MNLNRKPDLLPAKSLKISEKRNLEIVINQNTDMYKNLFEEALEGIVFWTNDGQIVNANEAACRIFETEHEVLITKRIQDFIYSGMETFFEIFYRLQEKGSIRDELIFMMPNGQKKSLEFTSKLHAIDGFHMMIFRNVTETRKMEKELRESEMKFRKIFEGVLEGIILWEHDTAIADMNAAGEEMLMLPRDSIIGYSFIDLLRKLNLSEKDIKEFCHQLKYEGQITGTTAIILPSGETKHMEFSAKQNVISELSIVTFKDVTEKLEMDEQLRKSDTLNVVGELAAGIAHEIRNPMTALKGFIQLLESSVKEDHSMYFHIISSELQRIDSIINEFLILAKPQAIKFIECDITQIMKETVELLSAQAVLHNVQFRTTYENDLKNVYCEPNQLKKVFINLIKNAIEVMPGGGFINIMLNSTGDERIHISIQDEGSGIPKDKLEKLGQPFYTTKERGTGLGLMVTYKIIEEHKGKIEVESEVGVGTIFNIFLPLNDVAN